MPLQVSKITPYGCPHSAPCNFKIAFLVSFPFPFPQCQCRSFPLPCKFLPLQTLALSINLFPHSFLYMPTAFQLLNRVRWATGQSFYSHSDGAVAFWIPIPKIASILQSVDWFWSCKNLGDATRLHCTRTNLHGSCHSCFLITIPQLKLVGCKSFPSQSTLLTVISQGLYV